MRLELHTNEVRELHADLGRVPARAVSRVRREGDRSIRLLADQWRRTARRSSGSHGKHYHKAITEGRAGLLSWEAGPERSRRQGGMSFEYGSRNQPPHMDGNNAADREFPRFQKAIGDTLGEAFR